MSKKAELSNVDFDREWHLAKNEDDTALTKVEHALMRCYEGFARWQSACLAAEGDLTVTGPENTLLHLIRMHETKKSMVDLMRVTNRDDIPNVQYALRKLRKAGLIKKHGAGRSGVTYSITDEGRKLTERYAILRQTLLVDELGTLKEMAVKLEEASSALNVLSGAYQKAAFLAETHARRPVEEI